MGSPRPKRIKFRSARGDKYRKGLTSGGFEEKMRLYVHKVLSKKGPWMAKMLRLSKSGEGSAKTKKSLYLEQIREAAVN